MHITQDYLQEVNDMLLEILDTIPEANAVWSVRDDSKQSERIVEITMVYGSEFHHDHFQEDTHDHRTVARVIKEWNTYIDEAKNTTPIAYAGDARLVNDAIGDIVCYFDDAYDIDTYVVNHLIKLRDKLHAIGGTLNV